MSTRYCSSGPLLPHTWWGVPKEIPTLVCNGGEANREYSSMPRWDPRRKSVPPAQTLRAKHLLAYLPRPALDSAWYSSFLQQARTTEVMAATTEDTEVLCAFNKVVTSETTPPPPLPRPLSHHLDLCGSETASGQSVLVAGQSRDVEEILEPLHSQYGGQYFRHLSSRWSPSPISGDHQPSIGRAIPLDIPGYPDQRCESARRPKCKLIEEAPQLYTSAGCQRQRYVTKDGKCRVNLGRIEDKSRFLSDIFTTLVDMKYRWFLFVFTMCYIVTWVAFAIVYFLDAWLRGDVDHVQDPQWHPCFEKVDGFLSALLLSVESQRTIGYGFRMVTANCVEGVVLIMAQSIIGSIIDALMVGCMFVKISRPQKRAQTLIFSKCCVISERDEKLCLLFRIGDLRESHMVDAKIRAKLIKSRETKEGEFIPLEQSEINLGYDTGGDRLFLVEPQTITHVINESSPFWEIGAESLRRERFEIIVILEGIVEASGMTCQARTSYTEDEIMWGHRFESCMSLEKEAFGVDYSVFHKTFEVQTSPLSAKERTGENATHF